MTEAVSIYREEMRPKARTGSTSTSVAAAIETTAKAPALIDRIWTLYGDGPASPEQIHAKLEAEAEDGRRILLTTVRARICGLHKAGRLIDSGERALGESLKSKVIVWRRTTPEEFAAHVAAKAAEADHD